MGKVIVDQILRGIMEMLLPWYFHIIITRGHVHVHTHIIMLMLLLRLVLIVRGRNATGNTRNVRSWNLWIVMKIIHFLFQIRFLFHEKRADPRIGKEVSFCIRADGRRAFG
jgi:hypothetical protein